MDTFNITEIDNNVQFTSDIFLDEKFILWPSRTDFPDKLRQALLEWEFRQVQSAGEIAKDIDELALQKDITFEDVQDFLNDEEEKPKKVLPKLETEDVSAEFQDEEEVAPEPVVEQSATPSTSDEKLDATESVMQKALRLVDEQTAVASSIDNNQLNLVQTVYNEYVRYIFDIYTHYATHKELRLQEISNNVKELCVFINEHRRYMLRVQSPLKDDKRMYLINHAIKSTVLAITIAIQLRMPLAKQVELGVACILHEIGMLKLSPQVYMTNEKLSPAARNTIFTHPLLSYNILKEQGFPLSMCLGVLEHHEKENGVGYPRRLPGAKISIYAKIISVACSFDAITSNRAHREAQSSYDAMVELLRNDGGQYDQNIIKALLFAVSLYPIGAYVFLHNGKIGQVVDVNPLNPKLPILQLVGVKDAQGEPVTVQVGQNVRIVRTLSRSEVEDLLKSLKKTNQDAGTQQSVASASSADDADGTEEVIEDL